MVSLPLVEIMGVGREMSCVRKSKRALERTNEKHGKREQRKEESQIRILDGQS